MSHLSALPVVVPFIAAALLVTLRPLSRRWVNDAFSGTVAIAVVALCAVLLAKSSHQPIVYWMGGWRATHGVTIGISFSIDPFGAGMATLAAVLICAALAYSVRYFDAVDGLFQALMLLFGAGMVGFCLTGDLFDLIVFFELMGAAAYALTGYLIEERAPLPGAINFAITNSIAGYAMFAGVALLYARTGALNMAQIGLALDRHGADPLVMVAMALLFVGFLTKAAAVPVHFWLADAHAVAPVPVCVLFSGVMIELGVYAVARLYWVIFAGPLHPHVEALRAIFIAIGVTTALLGAFMCVLQRHIKRLLAFSSISHVGIFICGVGLLQPKALAGVAVYVIGHGLTKGALFMCAGVLLHRFASVDEFELHGRGRKVRSVGVLFALGGLLLAALPPFTSFAGKSLLEEAASGVGYNWLIAVFIVSSALTGGAVLRITGRVFLGWGPAEGPSRHQAQATDESEDEIQTRRDKTPPMMIVVPAVLLAMALAVALVPGVVPAIEQGAARFTDHRAYASWVLYGRSVHWPAVVSGHISGADIAYSTISCLGAIIVAGFGLFGRPLQDAIPTRLRSPVLQGIGAVRGLQSGHIGDYIAWWTVGAGLLGAVCLLALT
jgi:multicomponent Na+:H+ antiporter subunit D